jgi:hypothetical protein
MGRTESGGGATGERSLWRVRAAVELRALGSVIPCVRQPAALTNGATAQPRQQISCFSVERSRAGDGICRALARLVMLDTRRASICDQAARQSASETICSCGCRHSQPLTPWSVVLPMLPPAIALAGLVPLSASSDESREPPLLALWPLARKTRAFVAIARLRSRSTLRPSSARRASPA